MNERARFQRAVLIAGPTASGKSALALALADKLGGTVVNADSMQVYRDLRVITARPSADDEGRVPHRLYGHVDAAENYSVGGWLRDAAILLAGEMVSGRTVIFTGGTGLYFKALLQGLSSIPATPPGIRAAVRARLNEEGATVLHAELQRRDPAAAARLKPGDRTRVARALEVLEATGRSIVEWQRQSGKPLLDSSYVARVFLAPKRDELRCRIATRFDAMLAAGALDEVRALDARRLDPLLPVMKAHGVPWLQRHLRGELSLEQAADGAKADTRRYAKRQLTWFRHQFPDWPWAAPERAMASLDAQIAANKQV